MCKPCGSCMRTRTRMPQHGQVCWACDSSTRAPIPLLRACGMPATAVTHLRATDPAALRTMSRHARLGVPLPPRDAMRCATLLSALSQVGVGWGVPHPPHGRWSHAVTWNLEFLLGGPCTEPAACVCCLTLSHSITQHTHAAVRVHGAELEEMRMWVGGMHTCLPLRTRLPGLTTPSARASAMYSTLCFSARAFAAPSGAREEGCRPRATQWCAKGKGCRPVVRKRQGVPPRGAQDLNFAA